MRPAAWISTMATLIGLERYSNRFLGYNSTECVLTSDDIMSIMLCDIALEDAYVRVLCCVCEMTLLHLNSTCLAIFRFVSSSSCLIYLPLPVEMEHNGVIS